MVERDHQPHFLLDRKEATIFCGGTIPPTEVIHAKPHQEVIVEIFAHDTNNHVGEVNEPVRRETFLVDETFDLNVTSTGEFATRALLATAQKGKQ